MRSSKRTLFVNRSKYATNYAISRAIVGVRGSSHHRIIRYDYDFGHCAGKHNSRNPRTPYHYAIFIGRRGASHARTWVVFNVIGASGVRR
jgi:hypothetical protein